MTAHATRASSDMRRKEALIAVALGVVVLVIGLRAINPYPLGVLHDDAVYAILAKSLATGHGYRYLNLPGQPFATHFPPGYPAFLALMWSVAPAFPANVALFKIANAVLLVAGYVAIGLMLRQRVAFMAPRSWIAAFVVTAGIPMLLVSTLVLSETLFFAATTWALVAVERAISRPDARAAPLIAGLACGAAALVRTPGVALIGAAVIMLGLQRRVRDVFVTAGAAMVLLLPWQLWAAAHASDVPEPLRGAYGSYTAWLGDAVRSAGVSFIPKTVAVTSRQALDVLLVTVSPSRSLVVQLLAVAGVLVLVVFGVRAAMRACLALPAFIGLYLALVLIWPSPPARYIWGIWPLACVVPLLGARELWRRRDTFPGGKIAHALAMVVALVPVYGYTQYNVRGFQTRAWLRIPEQGGMMLRPLVSGVREHVAPNATVAVTAEAAVYLYTGRSTVPMYGFSARELFDGPDIDLQTRAVSDIVTHYPVDAIVGSTALQHRVLERLTARGPDAFVVVDSFPGSLIYRRMARGTN